MPIGTDGLFSRVWRFVDQFAETDRIFRQDMDTALDDIVVGVNQSLLSSRQYDDVADATAASIPAAVLRISTAAYDADAAENSGGAYYARSSASGVAGYPSRSWFQSADGAYWLLDEMQPTPKQFGCLGGAVFSTQTGNDDATGFAHFIDHVNAAGVVGLIEDYYMLQSGDFLSEGIRITASSAGLQGIGMSKCGVSVTVGSTTAYPTGTYSQSGTTITVSLASHGLSSSDLIYLNFTSGTAVDDWFNVVTVSDTNTFTVTADASLSTSGNIEWINFPSGAAGIKPLANHVIIRDMEIEVRQISGRPSSRGNWGANIDCGWFGYGATQPEYVGGVFENLILSRAARGAFSSEHDSDYSLAGMALAVTGNHNHGIARNIHVKGNTNALASYGVSFHWGCSAEDPEGNPGETYHPHGWEVQISSMENVNIGAFQSASYDLDIDLCDMDVEARGFYSLPGDNSDVYAVARDAGKANRGIRVSRVIGTSAAKIAGEHFVEIGGQSESKWEEDADSQGALRRFPKMDIQIGTVQGELTNSISNTDCVYVYGARGQVKIGPIVEAGFTRRALYAANTGDGHLEYSVIDAEQGVYLGGVGSFLGHSNDCAPSYSDTDTAALTVLGSVTSIGTNDAAVSAGATTMQLASGASAEVFPGDILEFGGNEVKATSYVRAGMTTVNFEAIVTALGSGGQTVTVRRIPSGTAQPNVKKARYGVRVQQAEVDFFGMGPRGCGQSGYKLEEGAICSVGKAWPRSTGLNTSTSTNYDVQVGDDAVLTITGAKIGEGTTHLEAHIYVEDEGFVAINGARYEGSATLITTETANDRGRFTIAGLVDAAGTQQDVDSSGDVIDKYGTWTPVVEFGGASTGITYSAQGGNYRINGNEMTVDFDVTLSANGSATGSATISGMPDPWPSASSDDLGVGYMHSAVGLGGGGLFLGNASGEIAFNEQGTTGITAVDEGNAGATTRFKGKMTVPIGA